ncbi:MAG TPA: PPC domain-containing protein [Bryobacteraceae bacterium]|nr:PPC domain-containing protein [Bryobacteraceae bacterium]
MIRTLLTFVFLAAAFSPAANATANQRSCSASFPMTIGYGDDVINCKLAQVGQTALLNFQGNTGDHITIVVTASWSNGPCFGLYDPTNTEVGTDACAYNFFGDYEINSNLTLAKTGQYTIRVHDSNHTQTGTFSIMLDCYYPVVVANPLTLGLTSNGTTVNAETIDDWTFSGVAGEDVTVQVNSSYSNGPCFDLNGPSNVAVGSVCAYNFFGDYQAMGEFTLPAAGTYVVRVYSSGWGEKGTYSLFAQCLATCPSIPVPNPVSVSPASGSGSSQVLSFTFNDSSGWQDLDVVNILINNVLDGRNACYLAYSRSAGVLYLVADNGGALSTGLAPGGPGSVSNSQCTVAGASSTAAGSGNVLTVTLNMVFGAGFGGNKVVYMAARDLEGDNSGWQALGTWNVPGTTPTGPWVSGMNPAHSNNLTQSYTFTFTDTNGWQDISIANVLINSAINGIGACYVAFAPSGPGSGAVYLVDNAGDAGGPYSGMVLPSNGSVSNGQCTIAGSGSSVAASGNTLNLTLAITFNQSFAGNQIFFLAARSTTLNSNWQAAGTVVVP